VQKLAVEYECLRYSMARFDKPLTVGAMVECMSGAEHDPVPGQLGSQKQEKWM
jgi:hypothetical protein